MSTGDRDNMQDTGLDALVLDIVREEPADIEEPPDMVLCAYLSRKATAAEKTAVQRVLSQSGTARGNVIELGEYIETLSSDIATQRFQKAEAPPFRVAEHALAAPVTRVAWRQRVATAWQQVAATPAWKLAAVSAALVLVVGAGTIGSRMFSFQPLVEPAIARYDAEIFAPQRGVRRGQPTDQHDVAALQQFRDCLAYRNGGLEFDAPAARALDGDVTVRVHIVDQRRRKLGTLTAVVASDPAQLWISSQSESAPGQVEVRSLALHGRSAAVRLSDIAARGVWLVTYERNGHVYATECAEYSVAGD